MSHDDYEELEAEIQDLEERIDYGKDDEGNPLTEEEINDLKSKLRDKWEELKDMAYIDKYGIWAYNGVSKRDFV